MKNKDKVVRRCLKTALEFMPGHFAKMLLVNLFVAVLPLLGMQASREIYRYVQTSSLVPKPIAEVAFPLVLYALYLALMKAFVVYYKRVIIQFGGILEFEKRAKLRLHEQCGKIDMRYYETPSFYNGLWEAKVASINIYRIVECIIYLLCLPLSAILLSGYIATIHPAFFVFIFLTALPSLMEKICEGMLNNSRRRELTLLSKEERARRECLTGISFAKERLVYKSYDFLSRKWQSSANAFLEKEYAVGKKALALTGVLTTVKAAAVAGVYVLAAYFFFTGEIGYAEFMVAISTTLYLQAQYAELFTDLGYFSEFRLMVKPFFQFMDAENITPIARKTGMIEFNDVSFAYPTSDAEVLQDIKFSINPGETVVIVGVNGVGKTTLAKLVTGLLSPTKGETSGVISDSYAVMFQDFQRYALTLSENIAINELSPENPALLTELMDSLDLCDLPADVILGREFGETDLSGGQWQKIAMARLFYKGGELLVLDEPTSAIDPLYERELNDFILRKVSDGRTLVVISHRLSIAKLVDRVLVLDGGTIVEQGTHEKLLRKEDSLYHKLWTAQLSWYE